MLGCLIIIQCGWVCCRYGVEFPDVYGGIVLLRFTGGASAVGDEVFEKGDHFSDFLRMLFVEVVLFFRVCGEVVELDEGGAFLGSLGVVFGPATRAGAEDEFPVGVADGEFALDGMVNNVGSDGVVGALEKGEPAEAVFAG